MSDESAALLKDAQNYLIDALKGRPNPFETRHPWRKDWGFVVQHSLRVEAYTRKILAREAIPLGESEVLALRLAAILHDIGRLDLRHGHAQHGVEIAGEWIREHARGLLTDMEVERVLGMMAAHSNKEGPEPDFCKAVLKDADTLDEIGAISIFMAGNWVERQSPFFFEQLRQRLIDYEIPFCDQKMTELRTQGAKEILKEKKAFIAGFIAQLTDELQGEELLL